MQNDSHSTQIQFQNHTVALIKQNDRVVLKKLYNQNYKKVLRYVLQNSGSDQQAKDIYQEAFLAMWRNIKEDKFTAQNESSVSGYLYQIARNKWLDYLRSARHKKTTAITREFDANEELEENEETYLNQMKYVTQALDQMGERCKKVLQLFYFEKKTMREIALSLDLEESSARNAKYRCMEKLRSLAQIKTP